MQIQSTFQGVVAHRGSVTKAPENTVAAFKQAERDGAMIFELDVQESKDLVSIVMHDDTVDRTTNGSGAVSAKTAREIALLDAGSWFSPEFKGEPVPTLSDALKFAKDKMRVDVEVKMSAATPEYAQRLISEIEKHGMEDQVTVTSFNAPFLETIESRHPEIDTGLLIAPHQAVRTVKRSAVAGLLTGAVGGYLTSGSLVGTLVGGTVGAATGALAGRVLGTNYARESAETTSADHILPHWFITDSRLVDTAHQQGKGVVPYTVNNRVVASTLRSFEVDGVVTDRPEVMLEYFPSKRAT